MSGNNLNNPNNNSNYKPKSISFDTKEVGRHGFNIVKSTTQITKNTATLLYSIFMTGKKTIDLVDHSIGKTIKPGNSLKNFTKDNLIKISLAIGLAIWGGYKYEEFREFYTPYLNLFVNYSDVPAEYQEKLERLFSKSQISDYNSGLGGKLQDKRDNNYSGNNPVCNGRYGGLAKINLVKTGFEDMVKNGHITFIMNEAYKSGVPYDIVFLALAESGWRGDVFSNAGAGGY